MNTAEMILEKVFGKYEFDGKFKISWTSTIWNVSGSIPDVDIFTLDGFTFR